MVAIQDWTLTDLEALLGDAEWEAADNVTYLLMRAAVHPMGDRTGLAAMDLAQLPVPCSTTSIICGDRPAAATLAFRPSRRSTST